MVEPVRLDFDGTIAVVAAELPPGMSAQARERAAAARANDILILLELEQPAVESALAEAVQGRVSPAKVERLRLELDEARPAFAIEIDVVAAEMGGDRRPLDQKALKDLPERVSAVLRAFVEERALMTGGWRLEVSSVSLPAPGQTADMRIARPVRWTGRAAAVVTLVVCLAAGLAVAAWAIGAIR